MCVSDQLRVCESRQIITSLHPEKRGRVRGGLQYGGSKLGLGEGETEAANEESCGGGEGDREHRVHNEKAAALSSAVTMATSVLVPPSCQDNDTTGWEGCEEW